MKRVFLKSVVALAALGCAGLSQALTLDFEGTFDTSGAGFFPLMGHFDEITQNGLYIDTYSTKAGAVNGDLVGAYADGTDIASTCAGLVCPTNNASHFLMILNDGFLDVGSLDGSTFTIGQFDASFVAAAGDSVLNPSLVLRIDGYNGATMVATQNIYLPGPSATGGYSFATYILNSTFSATPLTEFAVYGYACTTTTTCTRALDKAQFAIDNIMSVSSVPEPTTWAMMGLGVAALALRRRAA
jgi:hypothetical protein